MAFYYERKTIRKLPGAVIKIVKLPDYELIEGFSERERVGEICKSRGFSSVLLVTDKTIFGLGFHEKITASLEAQGIKYTLFNDIDSEPTEAIVKEGRTRAAECGADCVIALGGGSVMDSAKIISVGARRPKVPISFYLHKFALTKGGSLPMINIPSTAGTGAECTVGAVVKNRRGAKRSTVILGLNVAAVILDSELLLNAPKSVTTWCAIDALSHGLEGLLADVKSTDEDIRKSRECVRLVFENLPILLNDPKNVEARQATLLAAHYGGNAINTQLAGYVHAFAHSIGALYHIPHGKAIARCIIPVVEAQKDIRINELAELAVYCGFASETEGKAVAADKMIAALKDLLELCGLEKECSLIREEDYDKLVKMIDSDSINYSPSRTFSDKEVKALLKQIRGC